MARPQKKGSYLNCKIESSLTERLESYCNETGASKTATVEKSLSKFLLEYEQNKVLLQKIKP